MSAFAICGLHMSVAAIQSWQQRCQNANLAMTMLCLMCKWEGQEEASRDSEEAAESVMVMLILHMAHTRRERQ